MLLPLLWGLAIISSGAASPSTPVSNLSGPAPGTPPSDPLSRPLSGPDISSRAPIVRPLVAGSGKMAKLYFRHGTVSSAKTLNLLAVAHTYKQQGKKVVVLKPALDTRFGKSQVASRAGLECEADFLLEPGTVLPASLFDDCHCVLVDEAQFVSSFIIDQLRQVTKCM
mmetsp:Transcript_3935/g.9358  ORF Transcript_3935/g.9358 Transcript_3935/m.9358 type:complete len:168 (-) Transcript_3935:701-1204(-)